MWFDGATGALIGKIDLSNGKSPLTWNDQELSDRDKSAAGNLLASTMRQIASELLESLRLHGEIT
jgi:hypothetical protein